MLRFSRTTSDRPGVLMQVGGSPFDPAGLGSSGSCPSGGEVASREMRERTYQFRAPFVIDASNFETNQGQAPRTATGPQGARLCFAHRNIRAPAQRMPRPSSASTKEVTGQN